MEIPVAIRRRRTPLCLYLKQALSSPQVITWKSGASGAGRSARTDLTVAEASDNFHAYAAGGHRHAPEMTHQISKMGQEALVTFVPQLLPMIRGIEVTAYVSTSISVSAARELFRSRYQDEPSVEVAAETGIRNALGSRIKSLRDRSVPTAT